MRTTVILAALAACNNNDKDEGDKGGLGDTGWFGSDTTKPAVCEADLLSTVPAAGEAGWYWRDKPEIFVQTASTTDYEAWLQDAAGNRIDTTLAWDETGLRAVVDWNGDLEASTDYVLTVTDCNGTTEVPFRTSALGTPLTIEPADLVGRTYLLDLVGADWHEPPLLGSIISSFFTAPVLLGVVYADPSRIDVVGAPGYIDNLGQIKQDLGAATWDFPMANFSDAPFIDLTAPRIELVYDDGCEARVPVTDFVLQGTFSADGTSIGGAVLSGIGDSRYLGCLLGDDDPAAVCNLAAPLGVECQPCGGDPEERYCLYIEVRDLEGVMLPELQLVER